MSCRDMPGAGRVPYLTTLWPCRTSIRSICEDTSELCGWWVGLVGNRCKLNTDIMFFNLNVRGKASFKTLTLKSPITMMCSKNGIESDNNSSMPFRLCTSGGLYTTTTNNLTVRNVTWTAMYCGSGPVVHGALRAMIL
uniref:Uncharacterized protein n=1 Tax=Cacopsylla melanoneura TaxID=428564 RepID=A0A8D8YWY9_9HEMI